MLAGGIRKARRHNQIVLLIGTVFRITAPEHSPRVCGTTVTRQTSAARVKRTIRGVDNFLYTLCLLTFFGLVAILFLGLLEERLRRFA